MLSNDSVECLTIRAVDDSRAIIVLRDEVQQGTLPTFHQDATPERDFALYLLASSCRSLSLDGLHFQAVIAKSTRHSLIFQKGSCLRITNCTCVDTTTAPPALQMAYGTNRFVCHVTSGGPWSAKGEWLTWVENNAFIHPAALQPSQKETRLAETVFHTEHYGSQESRNLARNLVYRNCLFGSNLFVVGSFDAELTEVITFEQCTMLGRMAHFECHSDFPATLAKRKFHCTDNLVIAPDNPVITTSADLFSKTQVEGGGNAYWQTAGTIRSDDRNRGSLSLLPGPLLKAMPAFGGTATAADPLKPFRLKSGPPLDKMATDGGTVGVRFEYLPAPPPFRSEMIKRVK
ncbi:MAG: hypothetical protein FD138_2469 [Planctomycetota bacterium]|nr:MAG: hypothetical protein FD138_2469 [Planctomycetota bacterium]